MQLRHVLAALAAVLLLPNPPQAAAAPVNLLNNPGLSPEGAEPVDFNGGDISGMLPAGWSDNSDWIPNVQIRYSLPRGAGCGGGADNGAGCIKAAVSVGFMQMGQWLQLPSGQTYRLSIHIRASPPQVVSLILRQAGEPYTYYGQATLLAVADSWRQVDLLLARVLGAGSPADCLFAVVSSGTGTLWLADAHLAVVAPGAPGQAAVVLAPPTVPIPRAFFCLNANHIHGEPGHRAYVWPALDLGTFRTWDSGVTWLTIQPEGRGKFVWALLDRTVREAQARRQQVLFTLGQTPQWASSRPQQLSVYGLGAGAPPADIADWRAFVRALARRYRGRIQAYEVWNEPDIQGPTGFYNGSPQQLVALEAAAADVLAEEDPGALLLTPPMGGGNSPASLLWLSRYLAAGGGRRAHAAAWHAYVAAPEIAINGVAALRQVLAAHGLQRLPVWNTEGGLDLLQSQASELSAAGFVARSLVVDWGQKLRRSCWYAYDSGPQYEGLVVMLPNGTTDPSTLNAAGKAYQQVMSWMLGSAMWSLSMRTDGIWVAHLQLPAASAARRAWIVWSPAGAAQLAVPTAWKAAHWQDAVSSRIVQLGAGDKVPVGEVPALLVSYYDD